MWAGPYQQGKHLIGRPASVFECAYLVGKNTAALSQIVMWNF